MAFRPCRELLEIVCRASEKAATLAREFRSDPLLSDLLVQRKEDKCVNGTVFQDVKTLADVLIQESVRKSIAQHFPDMAEHVVGEESALFRTNSGKEFTLRVCDTREETQALLEEILCDGLEEEAGLTLSKKVSTVLAEIIHAPIILHLDLPEDMTALFEPAHTGVWIDPIDCTSSFVKGRCFVPTPFAPILDSDSLPAVTVLIGAFDRRNGQPLLGVVNQPFSALVTSATTAAAPNPVLARAVPAHETLAVPEQQPGFGRRISSQPTREHSLMQDGKPSWEGRLVWGVSTPAESRWGQSSPPPRVHPDLLEEKPMLVHSKKERKDIIAALGEHYTLCAAPGAGYKLLCVIDGVAVGLATSSDSTYTWDTCGAHAILLAQGAFVARFTEEGVIEYHRGDDSHGPEKIWAHKHGLLIARKREDFDLLRSVAARCAHKA